MSLKSIFKTVLSKSINHYIATIFVVVALSFVIDNNGAMAADDSQVLELMTKSYLNGSNKITGKTVSNFFDSSCTGYINTIVTNTNIYRGNYGIVIGTADEGGEFAFTIKSSYRKDWCRVVLLAKQLYTASGDAIAADITVNDSAPISISASDDEQIYIPIEIDIAAALTITIKSTARFMLVKVLLVASGSEAAEEEQTSVSPTLTTVTVKPTERAKVRYTIMPVYNKDQRATFQSSDPTIATVDEKGYVTGVVPGTTTVTVTSVSNPDLFAIVTVKVLEVAPTSITVLPEDKRVGLGGSLQLGISAEPAIASTSVTWTATTAALTYFNLSEDGLITPIRAGSNYVTATSTLDTKVSAYGAITVYDFLEVESISLSADTMSASVGDQIKINALVLPMGASNKDIEWSSSNPDIFNIDSDGLATAHGEGSCIVSATSTDGSGCSAYLTLSVINTGTSGITITDKDCDFPKIEINGSDVTLSGNIGGKYLRVYAIGGQQIVGKSIISNQTTFSLPQGYYIVAIGEYRAKIAVR